MKPRSLLKISLKISFFAISSTAYGGQFCAVGQGGDLLACYPTLNVCELSAQAIRGACVLQDAQSNTPNSGLLSLSRALNPSSQATEERARAGLSSEEIREIAESEANREVRDALERGCEDGVRRAVGFAEQWAQKKAKADRYIATKKTEKDIKSAIDEVNKATLEEYRSALDYIYNEEKKAIQDAKAPLNSENTYKNREIFMQYRFYVSASSGVARDAMHIGWENPSASRDRLARLLDESCQREIIELFRK